MDLMQFFDMVLHVDKYLGTVIAQYGTMAYMVLFAIVFCETGLVVLPFLPGDTLLFIAGAFCATGSMSLWLLVTLLGDQDLQVPDKLMEVDLSTGAAREVLHATGDSPYFVLGQTLCLSRCEATCYLTDTNAQGLHRLAIGADGQVTDAGLVEVAPQLGLPPTAIGGF